VVDFVRSCYSTQAILDVLGNEYLIEWYFCDPGAPLLAGEHFASNNWLPDRSDSQPIGEVFAAARPWRNGSRPDFVPAQNPAYPIAGLASWFRDGAPGPNAVPQAPTWDGKRSFPGAVPGIFPPFSPPSTPPTLSTTGAPFAGPFASPGAWTWERPAGIGVSLAVVWGVPQLAVFPWGACFPGLQTLSASFVPTGPLVVLRCSAYSSPTSTWTDPGGLVLPGETLTLSGV
jgi:hypothetical protein